MVLSSSSYDCLWLNIVFCIPDLHWNQCDDLQHSWSKQQMLSLRSLSDSFPSLLLIVQIKSEVTQYHPQVPTFWLSTASYSTAPVFLSCHILHSLCKSTEYLKKCTLREVPRIPLFSLVWEMHRSKWNYTYFPVLSFLDVFEKLEDILHLPHCFFSFFIVDV